MITQDQTGQANINRVGCTSSAAASRSYGGRSALRTQAGHRLTLPYAQEVLVAASDL
ncbi:MAG: hypothetical protein JO345_11770 [Streptosporangiaceae bacterium]|nr:hypothetical protein [Streptosporangiaceae bacterium]